MLQKGDALTEQEYSDHAQYIREKFAHMIENEGEIPERVPGLKKFAQRVSRRPGEEGQSLTVTSLPEDYVHYSQ